MRARLLQNIAISCTPYRVYHGGSAVHSLSMQSDSDSEGYTRYKQRLATKVRFQCSCRTLCTLLKTWNPIHMCLVESPRFLFKAQAAVKAGFN